MTEMSRLIKLHARRLQCVYDERTAGDNTFISAFANFLIDIERARLDETLNRTVEFAKADEKVDPFRHTGINFIVQMQNTDVAALDERAKTLTDLGFEVHE